MTREVKAEAKPRKREKRVPLKRLLEGSAEEAAEDDGDEAAEQSAARARERVEEATARRSGGLARALRLLKLRFSSFASPSCKNGRQAPSATRAR